MYICICNSVTDKAIKRCVQQGHVTYAAVQEVLNVGTCCGRCEDYAREIIDDTLQEQSFALAHEVLV